MTLNIIISGGLRPKALAVFKNAIAQYSCTSLTVQTKTHVTRNKYIIRT